MMITGVSNDLGSCPRRRIPRRRKAPPLNTLIILHLPLCPHRHRKSHPFVCLPPYSPFLSYLQGNSILRGPSDVVRNIQSTLGANGRFPCSEPHTIAFSIGGTLFPVDPRDFIQQVFENNAVTCTSRLTATDPPSLSGYQFSWSLGDPFLKRCVLCCVFFLFFRPWCCVFFSILLGVLL
jgi:hypothetical protein